MLGPGSSEPQSRGLTGFGLCLGAGVGRRSRRGLARARGLGWARFFLCPPARRLSRCFAKLRATAPFPRSSSEPGPDKGFSRCPDHATGHLRGEDERAAVGNQAQGSAVRRGHSSRGSAGSESSPRSASSSDSTLKGSGPGPARPPPPVWSPAGFMPSDAGAMRRPAGAGLAGPADTTRGSRAAQLPRAWRRPRARDPIRRRCPFHAPPSNRCGRGSVSLGVHWLR